MLPTGEVWAWQAKYLLEFDNSAASQVEKFFKRALENEPALRRSQRSMCDRVPEGDVCEK